MPYTDAARTVGQAVCNRVENINTNAICTELQEALYIYQSHNGCPVLDIVDVVVVGSYIRNDFTAGDSDIDLLVVTDDEPCSDCRDYFWRYVNDNSALQTHLQTHVPDEVTYVDICDVVTDDWLQTVTKMNIGYSLINDQWHSLAEA